MWGGVSVGLHVKAYCERNGVARESVRGMIVMHTCDNPRCYNADHLVLGTQSANIKDMYAKGRQSFDRDADTRPKATGESHGQCVLSDQRVSQMRQRRELGITLRELAKEFGMSYGQTQRICAGESR